MSLPESMSRIVIVGAKSHIDDAIQVIYDVGSIHLIDHTVGADEGFSLGTSRPYSPKASERLLKVRAMEKGLGITPKVKFNPIPEAEIKSQISSDSVETVEAEVNAVFDRRNDLNQRITELSATKRNLEILSRLPIDLELYSGYRSIFSMVGTVADDPSTDLVNADVEVFSSFDKKEGNVIAVFARNEVRDKVQSILAEHGFSEIVIPEGITGSPSAALTAIARELFFLDECLEKTGAEKDGRIRLVNDDAWGFMRAADEPYDVIVNDAFSGNRPLGPLTSAEGARTVREHLAEDGVYLANVRCACEGRRAKTLREVEGAFGAEFSHVGYVPEWPDEPEKPGNNVLVATSANGVMPRDARMTR